MTASPDSSDPVPAAIVAGNWYDLVRWRVHKDSPLRVCPREW